MDRFNLRFLKSFTRLSAASRSSSLREGNEPSRVSERSSWLFRSVDAASLGFFRILFGFTMLVEVYRYFAKHRIREYYITPDFYFKYLYFEWVQPWPGIGMFVHFAFLGLLAAMITVGLFYRLATVLFFLGFTYVFLLDQARHLNHFYLVCLVSFLLCFLDANRWCSLDARWFSPGKPAILPFWQLFLLRAQMFLVYAYAGVAKLNYDWLIRGEPVRGWLDGPLEPWRTTWVVGAIAWSALLFDLGIGFLLLWPRTRLPALILAGLFHLGNVFLHHIGIFPYFAFALTLLFLEPDWPRGILRRLGSGGGDAGPETAVFPTNRRAAGFVAAYLTAQAVIPLRHWLYPGDVNWTEEGHRFSWRMKLRRKSSRMTFTLTDPDSGKRWAIHPRAFLTGDQAEEMEGRPDMSLQFAHHLRDHYARTWGITRIQVRIRDLCSLNRRPYRDLIRPDRDLADVRRTLWPADWIVRYPTELSDHTVAEPLPAAGAAN